MYMIKSDDEFKEMLSLKAYQVARCGSTETPFSGKYNDCTEECVYHCICCGVHLGHLFDEISTPTHKRYYINSVCLDLKPKDK